MNRLIVIPCLLWAIVGFTQDVTHIKESWNRFMADSQLQYASAGFELVKDGKTVFASEATRLLAPASTQKIITASTALELLGPSFRYATKVYMDGTVKEGILNGNLFILGSGDPGLGSSRYGKDGASEFLQSCVQALKKQGIRSVQGDVIVATGVFEDQAIPDGWPWQDIGNYYGAGVSGFNWRENQYDMLLESGNEKGSAVRLVKTRPELYHNNIDIQLAAGAIGSGDNAYIYFTPGTNTLAVRGTIPPAEKSFSISGAIPDPAAQFLSELSNLCMQNGIEVAGRNRVVKDSSAPLKARLLTETFSPSLDTLVYWFLQKSINLYGEALLKTIALNQTGKGSAGEGLKIIKAFWKDRGIPVNSLNIRDGSGLSPQGAVTPFALNKVLLYARSRDWFPYFFKGFPSANGMRMKSGTINGVRCYTGFLTTKEDKECCFTVMVNNYNGSTSALTKKIWGFLNECK